MIICKYGIKFNYKKFSIEKATLGFKSFMLRKSKCAIKLLSRNSDIQNLVGLLNYLVDDTFKNICSKGLENSNNVL